MKDSIVKEGVTLHVFLSIGLVTTEWLVTMLSVYVMYISPPVSTRPTRNILNMSNLDSCTLKRQEENIMSMWLCVFFTLLHVAVVRRFSSSSCHSSRHLAEWVTSIDALPGPEAHPGSRARAHVRRRVRQPWEVLCLGGCHREAHWCHGD